MHGGLRQKDCARVAKAEAGCQAGRRGAACRSTASPTDTPEALASS